MCWVMLTNMRHMTHTLVLCLQLREVLLHIPYERTLAREQQVHLLECAVRRLGVECPNKRDREEVDGGEDVEGVLGNGGEHDGVHEC